MTHFEPNSDHFLLLLRLLMVNDERQAGQIKAQEGANARKCHGNQIDKNGGKKGERKKKRRQLKTK